MREHLILAASLVLAGVGVFAPQEQLLMMVGENGELFKPVSSGAEDPFLIKIGLGSYVVTAVFTLVSLLASKCRKYVFPLYLGNGALYVLVMALVFIDSSVFLAAQNGNWLPLGQLAFWLVALVSVIWVSFNKRLQPRPNTTQF